MQKMTACLGIVLLILACHTLNADAQGQTTFRFRSTLNGSQEVPPNESDAIGHFMATLDQTQMELAFELDASNFTNPFTAAHIHQAPSGENGPIVFTLDNEQFPNFMGTWTLTPEDAQDLFAGNLYVDVHSEVYTGGEIRGQIDVACDLYIGQAMAGTGQTIQIPVNINQAPNEVDAMGLHVIYDPNVLQYTGTHSRGPLVENWSFFDVSNPEAGRLTIGGFTVTDPIQTGAGGTVVILEFLVVCPDCQMGEFSQVYATNLIDDIATWGTCPGGLLLTICVEGEGLAIADSRASAGRIVSIPVTVQQALNEVDALGLDVHYDPQVLRFTGGFSRGDLVMNWNFIDASELEPGIVRVGAFTVTDTILAGEEGVVVELEFEVICAQCGTGTTSEIFVTELVDDIATWPACPGTFTVGCPSCGDVDLSNGITPTDALLAFRHFLEFIRLEDCELEQADVDGDGEVTSGDALEIFKEFFHLPNVIDPGCWPDRNSAILKSVQAE